MASFEPILRMDENAFRAPEKLQPKVGRRPLTDMTNSRKPPAKNKSSVKKFSAFKTPEKVVQPKVARKPLGDLTNSNQPRVQEVSAKKNVTEHLSAVNKEQSNSFGLGEGFLHNHDECIKANQRASTMSLDYFVETVALKRDSSASMITPQLSRLSKPSKLELETAMVIDEMDIDFSDISAPPTPTTPKCPGSPGWRMENSEFSPLRLKDSPIKG